MKIVIIVWVLLVHASTLHAQTREWRFQVFLDKKEIGQHVFHLSQQGNRTYAYNEAKFEYRLLFVKLYGYTHRADEIWDGNCLTKAQSTTNDNGKLYDVSGERTDTAFIVNTAQGVVEMPACSMSFAYWNPLLLEQKQLINMQNGELLDITISPGQSTQNSQGGELLNARHTILQAKEMRIELWYNEDNEWLAMQSTTRDGRLLRYVLIN